MDISLALGGGGSKGNAHIGVLRILERAGIGIGAIAGTSIGALIGAVYLAGNSPDDIENRLADTEMRTLFRRGPEASNSLLGLAGVAELLAETLGEQRFEDLPIPFAVTAVDLITGQDVVLRHGRLLDAVLAAIALPGIFPSKPLSDYELVDGGISNPVPVALARSLAPSLPVVAVPLSRAPQPEVELNAPSVLEPIPLLDRIAHFRWGQALTVFTRSMAISGALLTEYRLQVEKPEVIIRPPVSAIGILDRVDVHEVARLGEQAAEEALPNIYRHLHWHRRLVRRVGLGHLLRRLSRHDF